MKKKTIKCKHVWMVVEYRKDDLGLYAVVLGCSKCLTVKKLI